MLCLSSAEQSENYSLFVIMIQFILELKYRAANI